MLRLPRCVPTMPIDRDAMDQQPDRHKTDGVEVQTRCSRPPQENYILSENIATFRAQESTIPA